MTPAAPAHKPRSYQVGPSRASRQADWADEETRPRRPAPHLHPRPQLNDLAITGHRHDRCRQMSALTKNRRSTISSPPSGTGSGESARVSVEHGSGNSRRKKLRSPRHRRFATRRSFSARLAADGVSGRPGPERDPQPAGFAGSPCAGTACTSAPSRPLDGLRLVRAVAGRVWRRVVPPNWRVTTQRGARCTAGPCSCTTRRLADASGRDAGKLLRRPRRSGGSLPSHPTCARTRPR